MRLMIEKADSNRDGKVTFDDFYSVMIKDIYWLMLAFINEPTYHENFI